MADVATDLVRIDDTGTAHPVSRTASQKMRARKGTFRVMPAPSHVVFMRYVGEDGRRDDEDGPVVKLAGEVTKAGSLCDIVSLVGHSGWKGELVVLDGQTSRSVFFEQGKVIGAQSTAEGERLGEILYQYGALNQEQIEACVHVTGKRIGEAAIEFGFLTREKLYQLMGKQVEEIVYNILRVGDGMFYFLDRYDENRLSTQYNLASSALLMEGVRRMDELSYFRERIPSDDHVPVPIPNKKGAPSKELIKVWEAADGERSVADIGRHCEISLFEATQAVFQLLQGGHIKMRSPEPRDPVAIVNMFNVAMRSIFHAVGDSARASVLRSTLTSYASSAGAYDSLFLAAGPLDDGSLKVERIVSNIAALAGDDAVRLLTQWLYEYVAFAMFAANSLLPKEEGVNLTKKITDIIAPLRDSRSET